MNMSTGSSTTREQVKMFTMIILARDGAADVPQES